MFVFTRILNLVFLSVLSIAFYIESKSMKDHNNIQKTSSGWIDYIKQAITFSSKKFQTTDNQNNLIELECELVDPTSPRLNQAIKESSEVLAQMYTAMELQFAKKHPEMVGSEMFLKPLSLLFKDGVDKVDWKVARQVLYESLKSFLTTTDFAKYGGSDDIQFFVTAKNIKSNELLGIIQFLVTPQFAYGTIKVAMFGIDESVQNRGIEQLLLSTIFRLIPTTERIFLHTRITNITALSLYEEIGFIKIAGPLPFWVDMEYLTDKADVLQKTSKVLIK